MAADLARAKRLRQAILQAAFASPPESFESFAKIDHGVFGNSRSANSSGRPVALDSNIK